MVIGTLAVDVGLLHLVQRGGAWVGCSSPLLAVLNVTAHSSTASVLASCYSMWHYKIRLLYKWLNFNRTYFVKCISASMAPDYTLLK